MGKNNQEFSVEDAMRIAGSPTGQQLLAMLRRQDSDQLQKIIDQANSGNYKKAGSALSSMLSSPEAQALLKKLQEG